MADISFSSWINAWSIDQGLRKLEGRKLRVTQTGGLIQEITTEPQEGDTLFFTDEASMRKYVGSKKFLSEPQELPRGVFDDKLVFAEYVEELGIQTILYQKIQEETQLSFPILVKARHSWKDGKHVHRGWVGKSKEDLPKIYSEIERKGFQKEDYFYQEWVEGILKEDNYSVCGYWDAKANNRNLIAVVQRMSSYNSGQSCSSCIAVIPDPGELIEKTQLILNSLEYRGPFEMEFLKTETGFLVLEFNARFWYQNAIFIQHENGLIKRYLGIEEDQKEEGLVIDKGTWVDGIWLLRSLLKLQFKVLKQIKHAKRLGRAKLDLYPSIPVALKYFVQRLITRKPPPGTN